MTPFTRLDGIAASLLIDNIDTDAIIPSRETQSVLRTGYGEKLFANWRYTPGTRDMKPEFVLNRKPFDQATILIAGRNFGCGSSREAAVWALSQFGIRSVIAESYGTIFRNNCVRNGLLPIVLSLDAIEGIHERLADADGNPHLSIDLEACTVTAPDSTVYSFTLDAFEREMLLTGADEVELTLKRRHQIEAFRIRDRIARPWVYQHSRAATASEEEPART